MKRMKEEWKVLPLDYEFENQYKIEISNFGKVKTYNSKHPEGKILSGTLQAGFPIVRVKLFKKRKKYELDKLDAFNAKINALNADIKALGNSAKVKESKQELRKERDLLIKARSKYNKKTDLKRTINFSVLIHKAVAELFIEKPAKKSQKFVIHKDFDKTNNKVDNLAWASQAELNKRYMQHPKNVLHVFRKQFENHKPNVRATKLQENDVLLIKKRLKKGDTLRKLAERFQVSDMQIHRIKSGENWSHVKLIEDLVEENKK